MIGEKISPLLAVQLFMTYIPNIYCLAGLVGRLLYGAILNLPILTTSCFRTARSSLETWNGGTNPTALPREILQLCLER